VHWHLLHHGVDAGPRGKLKRVARALYKPDPSADEARTWGLTVEEASGPEVEIWPDNLTTVNVFIASLTQWRIAPSGDRIGLDYTVLPTVLELTGVPKGDWQEVFSGIRLMEDGAMQQMRLNK
jgi:hypothetical protein